MNSTSPPTSRAPTSRRFLLLSGAGAALAAASRPAMAQGLGGKPVRLVVPYAAGGGADFAARLVAQKLAETSSVRAIVDNRPGASGMIGSDFVAKAPADGYTLLFCDTSHAVNAAVYPKATYDPVKDFKPLTLVGSSPQILVAHPSVAANSLKELLAMPREATQNMAIGSPGLGTGPHLAYEMLRVKTGLTLVHVPHKGSGQSLTDVVSGQIPLVMNSIPACMPHILAKRLKPLAIASAAREPRLPEVQTFSESAPGVVVTNWYGILAPAQTPNEVAAQLTLELRRVLDLPEVKERFTEAFLDPMPQGNQAFATFLDAEIRQWKSLVAQIGFTLD